MCIQSTGHAIQLKSWLNLIRNVFNIRTCHLCFILHGTYCPVDQQDRIQEAQFAYHKIWSALCIFALHTHIYAEQTDHRSQNSSTLTICTVNIFIITIGGSSKLERARNVTQWKTGTKKSD